jgi:hypothetical protein
LDFGVDIFELLGCGGIKPSEKEKTTQRMLNGGCRYVVALYPMTGNDNANPLRFSMVPCELQQVTMEERCMVKK